MVVAISMEESEQLLLSLWEMDHRGEQDQMQFRIMIDKLDDLIEVWGLKFSATNLLPK